MNFVDMDGYEFEDYISKLLKKMGFIVEQTTYSNDGGIDMVAFYDRPIFYGKYIIQCKNWQGTVGAPEIRDLYGVVTDQRANKGIIITPSDYTEQAYEFAKGKNIELINGVVLNALVEEYLNKDLIKNNSVEQNKIPKGFNNERYEYLMKKINDDYKNSNCYIELKTFLWQYIKKGKSGGYYPEIINRLIKNQDGLMQKCYNAKNKMTFKRFALIEKANYLLLIGKLDEALEIILDKGFFSRRKVVKPVKDLYSDFEEIPKSIGCDVNTRNLYMIFKAISYTNGIDTIDGLKKWGFQNESTESIKEEDKKILDEYQNWNDNKIYLVDYNVTLRNTSAKHEYDKYWISQFSPFYGKNIWIDAGIICKNFYRDINEDYYRKLDKVFLQHGYRISQK